MNTRTALAALLVVAALVLCGWKWGSATPNRAAGWTWDDTSAQLAWCPGSAMMGW